jgi:hypothetical protein
MLGCGLEKKCVKLSIRRGDLIVIGIAATLFWAGLNAHFAIDRRILGESIAASIVSNGYGVWKCINSIVLFQ